MNQIRVLVSYSHDSPGHAARVRQIADSLKHYGLDVRLDQYLPQDPLVGWPLWMEKEIAEAEKVLMVCTETYLRRVKKEEVRGVGRGVCWEANLIYAELYESQTKSNKFIPIILEADDRESIPRPLGTNTFFLIRDGVGFEELLRYLLGRKSAAPPASGAGPRSQTARTASPFRAASRERGRARRRRPLGPVQHHRRSQTEFSSPTDRRPVRLSCESWIGTTNRMPIFFTAERMTCGRFAICCWISRSFVCLARVGLESRACCARV